MKKSVIQQLLLYRYRYVVGYTIFFIALIGLIIVAGFFIPGAITQQEMDSAVTSATLSLGQFVSGDAFSIINLPYHLLQKASIAVFGLSDFSIKLPSLLLSIITGAGFFFLLRQWFTHNIAILAAIIAITTSQFLIIAQTGTPLIMLLFWPTFLLLIATRISSASARFRFGWMLLFAALLALSLYTPLSVYVILAMLAASLLHPHLRYMLKHIPKKHSFTGAFMFIILLLPLGWGIYLAPDHGLTLLGIPTQWPDWPMVQDNAMFLAHAFFGFAAPTITDNTMLPLYGLATSVLILLGILKLGADHHSARSYTIGLWGILLLVVVLLQPQSVPILFIPLLLILAIGLHTLFYEWYSLFPRNPYARIAALVPIAILLGVMVFSGVERFQNSYRYDTNVAEYFTTDLQLVRDELSGRDTPTTLLVPEQNSSFYHILERKYDHLTVTTDAPSDDTQSVVILASAADSSERESFGIPDQLVTNSYADDALRLRVYSSH